DTAAKDAPEPVEEVKAEPVAAYITATASMKKTPSDAKKIADPTGKSEKQVSNWITTMRRGEEVTIIEDKDDWAKIQITSEEEGWIKTAALLKKEKVEAMATVMENAKVFERPEMLAIQKDREIPAGSLLFILKEKDTFSEVNYPASLYRSRATWVMSSELNLEADDVAAAKVIAQILSLRKNDIEKAKTLEELARKQFESSKLIALLDVVEEEGEAKEEAEESKN
ncbi:SH3 domain-containing protein, partial [Myxococcota bacterium]|nr:SH3 domain-containing protein [Myxococcota bacterium]